MTEPRSTEQQEADEIAAAKYFVNTLRWVQRGPRILVLLFGLMGGTAATGAWIGTQAGDVTQADLNRVNARIDTLQTVFEASEVSRKLTQQDQNEKLDVLLRLGCPEVTRADLVKACRDVGVPK